METATSESIEVRGKQFVLNTHHSLVLYHQFLLIVTAPGYAAKKLKNVKDITRITYG